MTPITQDLAPLASEATELLKALAHPERLMICCQLRDTELSVGDIETTLGIKQPRLSRELSKLRDTGLVTTRKESKLVFYTLSDKRRVREMVDAICAVMLGKAAPNTGGETVSPKLKPNRPGGYGVFACTGS
ncbi:MAG: metalloregulator ArsR/SmtB family transcription factor [Pseudomonadota bacterium]|nr:metalloregulator ArsR/SmtB family transcription factor [Pseudomonadota bacterium]